MCILLVLYWLCVVAHAEGTTEPDHEVVSGNFSQLMTFTCEAVCGTTFWSVNGERFMDGISSTIRREGYKIEGRYTKCSESTDPNCPDCGCNNCAEANASQQTLISSLNVSANRSIIVECFSLQTYTHTDPHRTYILLLRSVLLSITERKFKNLDSKYW